jgi:pimeloyl-ACP methyl ester carboxylesterase
MHIASLIITLVASISLGLAWIMIWYEVSPLASVIEMRLIAVILSAAAFISLIIWMITDFSLLPVILWLGAAIALTWSIILSWFTYNIIPISAKNGEMRLAGTLYQPPGDDVIFPAVVFLPGPGKSERNDFRDLAKYLCRHKIAALIYDKRGCGDSTGSAVEGGFAAYAQDAAAMIWALRSEMGIDPQRIGVFAYDEAGWVVPLLFEQIPNIASLVLTSITHLSPAEHTLYKTRQVLQNNHIDQEIISEAIRFQRRIFSYHRSGGRETQSFRQEVEKAARQPWFKELNMHDDLEKINAPEWWKTVMDFNPEPRWQWVHCPVLMISGADDPTNPVRETHYVIRKALRKRSRSPFKSVILPHMEHEMLRRWLPWKLPPPKYPSGLRRCMLKWFQKHLSKPA